MGRVVVVTDTSADLDPRTVEDLGIHMIPLKLLFGQQVFHDRVDITPAEFYRKLEESDVLPTTSQPSAGDFLAAYQAVLAGAQSIVSIHISGVLSGTIDSAYQARTQMPAGVPIHIIDSRSASMGLGFIVLEAARLAARGEAAERVVERVQGLIPRVHVLFAVDTLEFLYKGGRIGGAERLLGSMLRIKPLLHLQDGRIDALEKTRTKPRALTRLLQLMEERVGEAQAVRVAVAHAAAEEEALSLKQRIAARFPCRELFVCELSPVLGAHTGPGVVGAAFYSENEGGNG